MRTFAPPGPPATIGDLAVPSQPVRADEPCLAVEARVMAGSAMTSVVVRPEHGEPRLLARSRLQSELTGPKGFGRSLYSRRRVGDIPAGPPTLRLAGSTSVAAAGEAMLARDRDSRYEDALVAWPDGRLGTVTMAAVVEHLALAYKHQSLHDPLTGLPNRALFADRVEQALRRLRRATGTLAVLFIDLDDFKLVNDGIGHHVGDQVLVAAAERLAAALRPGDTASRWGGDEFAVLLEDLHDPGEASLVAQRLLSRVQEPTVLGRHVVVVRASVGIAVSAGGSSAGDLLRNADVAMYRAKERGKSCWQLFEPGMRNRDLDRRALASDIERGLQAGEFVAHYQPVVELGSGRIVGTEALVRWRHPRRGLLAPAAFIPTAEDTGLIVPMGLEMLRQAVRQTMAWDRVGPGGGWLRVSVNLSPCQIQEPGLGEQVAQVLREAGLDPARLTLEITERVLVADAGGAEATLAQLKRVGVALALDDFGTGYSALGYLQRIPVDVLKLDKVFIDGVTDESHGDSRLAAAVVMLGEMLGLDVVAEGIERAEQVAALRRLGCRLGQGYHFSRPLAAPDLEALLHAMAPLPPPGGVGRRVGAGV